MGSDFPDPLGQGNKNVVRDFLSHSLGLLLGGQGSAPSLALLYPGKGNGQAWAAWSDTKISCSSQQPGPGALHRSLASCFILGLCSEAVPGKGRNQLAPSPSSLLCHEQGDVQEII